jgi:hypothetical protein
MDGRSGQGVVVSSGPDEPMPLFDLALLCRPYLTKGRMFCGDRVMEYVENM